MLDRLKFTQRAWHIGFMIIPQCLAKVVPLHFHTLLKKYMMEFHYGTEP